MGSCGRHAPLAPVLLRIQQLRELEEVLRLKSAHVEQEFYHMQSANRMASPAMNFSNWQHSSSPVLDPNRFPNQQLASPTGGGGPASASSTARGKKTPKTFTLYTNQNFSALWRRRLASLPCRPEVWLPFLQLHSVVRSKAQDAALWICTAQACRKLNMKENFARAVVAELHDTYGRSFEDAFLRGGADLEAFGGGFGQRYAVLQSETLAIHGRVSLIHSLFVS